MEARLSTIRNLLWALVVLVVLSALSGFYVATQLERNSEELASLRSMLLKEMMGPAMDQAQQLEKQMESLNQNAAGIDAKLQKAQDDFAARMQIELPQIMDNYIKQRSSVLQQKMERQGVPLPR